MGPSLPMDAVADSKEDQAHAQGRRSSIVLPASIGVSTVHNAANAKLKSGKDAGLHFISKHVCLCVASFVTQQLFCTDRNTH